MLSFISGCLFCLILVVYFFQHISLNSKTSLSHCFQNRLFFIFFLSFFLSSYSFKVGVMCGYEFYQPCIYSPCSPSFLMSFTYQPTLLLPSSCFSYLLIPFIHLSQTALSASVEATKGFYLSGNPSIFILPSISECCYHGFSEKQSDSFTQLRFIFQLSFITEFVTYYNEKQ